MYIRNNERIHRLVQIVHDHGYITNKKIFDNIPEGKPYLFDRRLRMRSNDYLPSCAKAFNMSSMAEIPFKLAV